MSESYTKMSDFFRALCPRLVCFHRHSGFERIYFYFYLLQFSLPDHPEGIEKAELPAQQGALHYLAGAQSADSPEGSAQPDFPKMGP
jgi:hypothetical protein